MNIYVHVVIYTHIYTHIHKYKYICKYINIYIHTYIHTVNMGRINAYALKEPQMAKNERDRMPIT